MLQILAATSNKHKVEEFKAAFAPLLSKMTILTADEIHGYPDIEENGTSFVGECRHQGARGVRLCRHARFCR